MRQPLSLFYIILILAGLLLTACSGSSAGPLESTPPDMPIFTENLSTGRSESTHTPAPIPPGEGYVEVGEARLYYEVSGEGPSLVLIHEGILNCRSWDYQFEAFADRYQVIRYDRRFYGRSEAPHGQYSNVEDLYALFQHLKVDKATLIGSSAGGGIAIDFTLAHPEKVDKLVLVGPVVSGYGYSLQFQRRSAANGVKFEKWLNDPYWIAPENASVRQRAREILEEEPSLLMSVFTYTKPEESPALGQLSKIRVPTLIIVGEADIPDVHAHAGAIESGIFLGDGKSPPIRIIIPQTGHLVYMEQPELFNKIVNDFLESGMIFE